MRRFVAFLVLTVVVGMPARLMGQAVPDARRHTARHGASLLAATATAVPRFEIALKSASYGGAAVADLDGDGKREIVFGTYYNDERVIALHADGTVMWDLPSGGGPVDGSVTVADLDRDGKPEVLWGNAQSTVFHVADRRGKDVWSKRIGEVLDAPAAVGDVNADGQLDIVLASCGGKDRPGGLRAFTGATGAPLWTADVGGCYQSAPLLFDQDGDGVLDVVVSTWFDDKVRAFSGRTGKRRWEATIGGWTYHAGSFGDLNGDGVPDVALGDYSGTLWAISGADGAVLWSQKLKGVTYVFGPTAMADLEGDGAPEIILAANRLFVFDAKGKERRAVDLSGNAVRGPVLTDDDGDGRADILVAMDGPAVAVYAGRDLSVLYTRRFAETGDFDHHPAIADLDGDGRLDVFAVYGRGQSDTPAQNWGKAVLWSLGDQAKGPEWPTYSHDHHHSGNYAWPVGDAVNRVGGARTATATSTPVAAWTSTAVAKTATATVTPKPTSTPSPRATATATGTSPTDFILLPALLRNGG